MSKRVFVFILIAVGLLIATCVPVRFVFAQANFHAFHGNAIADSEIDGVIGSEWNDAGSYTNVSINPWGIAHIWLKQDGTYLYLGLRFYADSNNPWVGFQFGSGFCMSTSADGALFGDDDYSANGYRDVSFGDGPSVIPDSTQDGKGAISINASNLVVVELKKPLSSGDVAGVDINWTQGNNYGLLIIWNSVGNGASGGSASHSTELPVQYTIFVDPSSIPEFPSTAFLVILLAVALPAFVLVKRRLKRAAVSSGRTVGTEKSRT
jgi:hypothetical protein